MIPHIGIGPTVGAAFAVAVASWLKDGDPNRTTGDEDTGRRQEPRPLDEAFAARICSAAARAETDLDAAERMAASVESKYHRAMAMLAVANKRVGDPRARHLVTQVKTVAAWLLHEFEKRDVLRHADFVERKAYRSRRWQLNTPTVKVLLASVIGSGVIWWLLPTVWPILSKILAGLVVLAVIWLLAWWGRKRRRDEP